MTTQGQRAAQMMIRGWTSYRSMSENHCGNCPWVRLKEWRQAHKHIHFPKGAFYPEELYTVNGKDYREEQRLRHVQNYDGRWVWIKQYRLVKVK